MNQSQPQRQPQADRRSLQVAELTDAEMKAIEEADIPAEASELRPRSHLEPGDEAPRAEAGPFFPFWLGRSATRLSVA